MEKLGREQGAVKKSVDLPEEEVRQAIVIGNRYSIGANIHQEGYPALVDALFEGHSIMAPFIGQGVRKN